MLSDDAGSGLRPTRPQEALPKSYDPGPAEARWYPTWEKAGVFRPEVNPEGEPFCVVIPPPNVTGSLHMGHAFEHSLIDATVRRKRMQGYAALWVPGTDHAGIATQNVVERELAREGVDRHELGREAFVERVWRWKEESGGQITGQMRRMGDSCDWGRERFTMDAGLSRAVREVFVRLFVEGLIYRANRIINWCPRCHTALSDIEVEHEEVVGELVRIRYPFEDGSGFVTVATTRAETMLGDTGVAVHPEDPRYAGLQGRRVVLPLVGRLLPIVADEAIDPSFGTGALKVTPAHDATDFEIASRHGLEAVDIFDADAVVNPAGGRFAGLTRSEARKIVKEALATEGVLDSVEEHRHAVGHCYRCRTVIEPRLSLQWFVKVAPLAAEAARAVREGRARLVPNRWEKLYLDWLDNLRDWCVSRQIWWGHRIPAWYCDCGEIVVAAEAPQACPRCAGSELRQDDDVLDTWFSSALWPFSTLGWPEQTADLARYYPNAMLHTGFDIIYFWVARMMQMGIHFVGDVPFREVAIHGLVRDADGRKMSKSFGNVVDPLVLAERYGVDALRFTLVRAASPGQDVPLAEEWVDGARHFVNKIWNLGRFVAYHLDGELLVDCQEPVSADRLSLTDRWILSRLGQVIRAVDRGFERYDFAEATRELQSFVWGELCDWYLELAKAALAGTARDTTRKVLGYTLSAVLRLLHPIVPFVTEELWWRLGGEGLLATARWPGAERLDVDADSAMAGFIEMVSAIRRLRSQQGLPTRLRPVALVVPAGSDQAAYLETLSGALATLAGLGAVEFSAPTAPPAGSQRLVAAGATIDLVFEADTGSDGSAATAERHRQAAKLEEERDRTWAKLSDPAFVDRAPPKVVEAIRQRHKSAQEALDALLQERVGE
ncbi:MAG: valine--tRNA ligase [Acidimicrobiia bacterium]